MKKLLITSLFIISGCSSEKIYSVGNLIDTHKKQLSENSKVYYSESMVNDTVPAELEKDKFYTRLARNESYKKYLHSECILLLHKEQALNLERPVYAAEPQWNNIENYFYMLFNFQSMSNDVLTEQTMECDVAVNKKKEVTDYQLKKSYLQFQKMP